MASVGTVPTTAECFICALFYTEVASAQSVLRWVEDDDVEEPAGATVLAAVRALALRGTPAGPQLVIDELKRHGKLTRSVGVWLRRAMNTGACDLAAFAYGGAVVAESYRSRVESFGTALVSVSETASEAEIGLLVERTFVTLRGVKARLNGLRGETT
jgi:hypothetical protein